MPLRPSKQYYQTSSEYNKILFLIDQKNSMSEISQIQRPPFLVFLSFDDLTNNSKTESSVFLKPGKDIELLERVYTFEHPDKIKRFLWAHQYLIDTCFKAYKEIRRVFGENTLDVSLEFDKDPEEDFEGLSIIVRTNLNPELSLELLEKFDEEWWLDLNNKIRNVMTVMVRPL